MADKAWRSAPAAVMLLSLVPPALAQTQSWQVTKSIGLRETYSDNATLAASPSSGEFVTQVSPALSINGRSGRLAASLNYSGSALFYSRNNENDRWANTLAATANLEAVEKFFYIDAQGNISQSFISPFAPRPSDLASATENRTEARTWSLSPYVRGQFLGGHSYELRNRNTWTSADSSAVPKVHTRQWSGSVASPVSLFGWAVDGSDTNVSYDDDTERADQESRMVRARLIFQPDSTFRVYGSSGREENNYNLEQTRSYTTYGYGARWQPTPRTSTQFDWEHRFFGSSRQFNFSHRTRLTAWSATYSRDISTYQQELLRLPAGNTAALLNEIFRARIPDPVQRQAAVEQFLRATGTPALLTTTQAFFTEQVSLQERLEGSLGIIGVRNSVTFTAFRTRSTALTEGPPGVPADVLLAVGSRVLQRGVGASASHQLTPFTSVSASGNRSFARAEEPVDPESRNDFVSLSLSHTMSPKTSTFGGVSYSRFHISGAPNTHARSVFAGLQHQF